MKNRRLHLILMLLALFALASATWAGLIRLGWALPVISPGLPTIHGPLMVAGFFGSLIALERAVALGIWWTYLSPLLNGIGGILLVIGNQGPAKILIILGSILFVMMFVIILKRQFTGYTVTMAMGTTALLGANIFWFLGFPIHELVPLWAGFLILTIAGERIELGRLIQHSKTSLRIFYSFIILYIVGMVLVFVDGEIGVRLSGVAMIGLTSWLLRNDIARRTIKQTGLTRFIAACLLSGYIWLIISGAISIIFGFLTVGPIYDAILHSIFLGFVFSMIFGHAPIIFPAVLGIDIQYRPVLYVPLILLHLTLLLRIGGELVGSGFAREWGGLLNVFVVISYLLLISPIPKLIVKSKNQR